jgi:hypothetical protein
MFLVSSTVLAGSGGDGWRRAPFVLIVFWWFHEFDVGEVPGYAAKLVPRGERRTPIGRMEVLSV